MADSTLTFFPATKDRRAAIAAGFRFGHIGTHTSHTIMLDELTATFAWVPTNGKSSEYAGAIVEENCLSKPTISTRRLTFPTASRTVRARPHRSDLSDCSPPVGPDTQSGRYWRCWRASRAIRSCSRQQTRLSVFQKVPNSNVELCATRCRRQWEIASTSQR